MKSVNSRNSNLILKEEVDRDTFIVDYLWRHPDFLSARTERCGIAVDLPMGAGKTWGSYRYYACDLYYDFDVRLHIEQNWTVAQINPDEVFRACEEAGIPLSKLVILNSNDPELKDKINPHFIKTEWEKGKMIWLLMTDHFFQNRDKSHGLMQSFREDYPENSINNMFSEIHLRTSSSPEWAREAIGVTPPTHVGRASKSFNDFKTFTVHQLGSTATLTSELLDNSEDSDDWIVVRPKPDQYKFVNHMKWVGDWNYLDYKNPEENLHALHTLVNASLIRIRNKDNEQKKFIVKYKTDNDFYTVNRIKQAMSDGSSSERIWIRVETKGSLENQSIEKFEKQIFDSSMLSRHISFVLKTDSRGWYVKDFNGNIVEEGKGNGWLAVANNYVKYKQLIGLVIDIGKVGVSVPAIVDIVSVRSSDLTTTDGDMITKTPNQYVGRGTRPWYGTLTFEELQNLPLDVQLFYIGFNKFNVHVPDTEHWRTAEKELKEGYLCEYNEVMKNHINYGNQKEEETIETLTEPKILDMLDVTDVLGNKVEITPEIKEFISKLNLTRKVDHFGSKNRMKTNEELFMDKLLENA